MTKKETILVVCVGLLGVLGLIFGVNKYYENQKLKAELKNARIDILTLLDEYLKTHNQTLPESVKKQIVHLKELYSGTDEKVALEFRAVEELIGQGKDELALQTLVKIVENLLKTQLKDELKDKRTALDKLLDMARKRNLISEDTYSLAKLLKDNRNALTHELAVKLDDETKVSMFVGGISIIYELEGIPNE